jgi:hypothetical protein
MLTVITFFWRLCTLRAHSSQVPAAAWFMTLVTVANIATNITLSSLLTTGTATSVIATAVVVQQATLACLVWLALYFRTFDKRFPATITAMFGCDLFLTAIIGALLPLVRGLSEGAVNSMIFVFFLWTMATFGHILHQALQIRSLPASGIAFGIWFLASMVSQAVLEPAS